MPELPEVENTVIFLDERTKGQRVSKVCVNWPRIVDRPSFTEFRNIILGKRIAAVERRGKYIVFNLVCENNTLSHLIAHMRMSGSFDVVSAAALASKHDHLIITLDNKTEIRYHDPRKFGRFYFVTEKEQVLHKLGVEPLGPEFSYKFLTEKLKGKKRKIKAFLLDQSIIAGIGNIYADEALWFAGIHPERTTSSIKPEKIKLLHAAIRKVLKLAIIQNGTDNGDNVVHGGMYKPKVYGRAGQKCSRCGSLIKKIIVAQRGTSFCSKCQR